VSDIGVSLAISCMSWCLFNILSVCDLILGFCVKKLLKFCNYL